MKTRFGFVFSLLLVLSSINAAQAGNNAVAGAIIGGGLGAIVGHQVGGRDGAVIGGAVGAVMGTIITSEGDHRHRRGGYYAPPARIYAPAPVYAAPVYYRGPRPIVHVPPPSPRNQWNRHSGGHGRR
jgi:hypothetical protein